MLKQPVWGPRSHDAGPATGDFWALPFDMSMWGQRGTPKGLASRPSLNTDKRWDAASNRPLRLQVRRDDQKLRLEVVCELRDFER